MNESVAPSGASLSRSGFDAFLTSIVILGLGLASNIAIARALGPSGKGQYDLLAAAGAMFSLFLGLSLPAGITYVVARGRARMAQLRLGMSAFVAGEGVIAAVVMFALVHTHVFSGMTLVAGSTATVLVTAFVVLSGASSLWRGVLIGRREVIRANRRDLATRVMQVGLIVIVCAVAIAGTRKLSPALPYAMTVAAAAASALLFVLAARGRDGHDASPNAFVEALRFAAPSYLSNVVQMANYRLDLFLVAYYATYAQVGLYALAVAVSDLVWLAPDAVALVVLPGTASAQSEVQRNTDRAVRGARMALWGGIVLSLLLLLVGRPVLVLLFTRRFDAAFPLLVWLLPGVALFCVVIVLASYIAGVGRPKLNLLVGAVALLVTLALDFGLIPSMGAKGAAIASTASYATSTLLTLVIFLRLSTARLGQILVPRPGDAREVYAAARAALARRDVR